MAQSNLPNRAVTQESSGRHALAVGLLALATTTAAVGQPVFYPIGVLPGGRSSAATAVSADGRAVTVSCATETNGYRFARWTAAEGLVDFGPGFALALSAAGEVMAGQLVGASTLAACIYDGAGGFVDLGVFPGGLQSMAVGMSGDGTVVAGTSDTATSRHTFRWTASGGMEDLGLLSGFATPATTRMVARGISADGTTIIGDAQNTQNVYGTRAFRWTAQTGMQSLGVLPHGLGSQARAVSADGTTIVGTWVQQQGGRRFFRWTLRGGMQDGVIPEGTTGSQLWAINANGTVIAGSASIVGGPVPFISSPRNVIVNLSTLLLDFGLDINAESGARGRFTLNDIRGVSGDGLTFVGTAVHEFAPGQTRCEAFAVRLPRTAIFCAADYNTDGRTTPDDLTAYINDFFTSPVPADTDLDGDGAVTPDDLADFIAAFFGDECGA